jgi:hypothetical protein
MASHIDALSALPDPSITARGTTEFITGLCSGAMLFSPSVGDGFTAIQPSWNVKLIFGSK